MTNYTPNRVAAGNSSGGQFAPKYHGEQDIDLEMDEFADDEYECESMHVLVKDYMDDIESNPTYEGAVAAAKKYRSEIFRLEAELKYGGAGLESYPDPDSWDLDVEKHGILRDEYEDSEFCQSRVVLELKAVARINEIRNQEMQLDYGKYRGDFPEGPAEIDMSIKSEDTDYRGTISKKPMGKWRFEVEPGYENSLDMLRSSFQELTSTGFDLKSKPLREAMKSAHDSGTGAAYTLVRSGFNRFSMEPEFTEIIIAPSKRETEKLDLKTPAIADGWL